MYPHAGGQLAPSASVPGSDSLAQAASDATTAATTMPHTTFIDTPPTFVVVQVAS
jgi:hypothetical protein